MALPSIIRIIEHYQVGDVGPDVPDQMPHTVLQATAVITLIPGNARGRYGIRLRPYLPSGQELDSEVVPVNLVAEQRVRLAIHLDLGRPNPELWRQVGVIVRGWFCGRRRRCLRACALG